MPFPIPLTRVPGEQKHFLRRDLPLLLLSIAIQLILALFFGHAYDMRIFMATGFLVGTGQNPYIAQDLSTVFHNLSIQGITTVGYPPPWPLMLGFLYRASFAKIPNFLLYNVAVKIPIIVANIGMAYLVVALMMKLGAKASAVRKAWIFLLLNPFLLLASTAWGQFDSIVAILLLISLVFLDSRRVKSSAILLALAIAFKPTALPLIPVAFFYLKKKSIQQTINYYIVLFISAFCFCVVPFFIFGWDPSPILQNWNAHFVVGGGISFMAFLELIKNSYNLTGTWWLLGLLWLPALGIATFALRPDIVGLKDLLRKSTALILVFFLTRAWISEPNIVLILPFVLILTSMGELDQLSLVAIWVLPLIFGFFNTSIAQLFFPSMSDIMKKMLNFMENYRMERLIAKVILVVPWQITGWWIVIRCYRRVPSP